MKAWPPIDVGDATAVAGLNASTPEQRMGEMLHSAVTRGALLNRDWWSAWIIEVQANIDLNGSLLAVELTPAHESRARRWFADPVTRLLIVRWHRDRLHLDPQATPLICLSAYLPLLHVMSMDLEGDVLRDACAAWRLRLPGALFAYATGEGHSVSASRSSWLRSAHGWPVPDPPRKSDRNSKPGTPPPEVRDYPAERAAICGPSRKGKGARETRRAKRASAKRISALPWTPCPVRYDLRRWAAFALVSERGTATIGYEISTTRRYLSRLVTLFRAWNGVVPTAATSEVLAAYLDRHLDRADEKLVNAAMSFVRFYNDQNPGDELELDEDDLRAGSAAASAELVSPATYRRAIRYLRDSRKPEAALILTLAFRTGVRVEEATALRVADVVDAGNQIELVVEENAERTLKTKTSRRILPLDVLLDDDERDQLMAWVADRRVAAGALGEAWLFGPVGAATVPDWKAMRAAVDEALRKVSGSDRLCFRHLRHSAASYLIATLLLPQDVIDPAIPPALGSVISPARFARVADRLLGGGRLGAGAVHAVSQLLGHTGPGTTLRWYCHLLDLVLGLYVSRATTMPMINGDWARELLNVGPDAARKLIERHPGADRPTTEAGVHTRPDRALIERHALNFHRNLANARLFASSADRLSRPLRRAATLGVEREASGIDPFEEGYDQGKRNQAFEEKVQDKPKRVRTKWPNAPYRVPWRFITTAVAGEWPSKPVPGVDDARLGEWLGNAARLRRWLKSPMSIVEPVPTDRLIRLLAEEHLTLSRPPRRAERNALNSALLSMRRYPGQIRLKRLGEARSFVELLRVMGFHDDEAVLAISNKCETRFPSARVHRWLRGEEHVPEITGRSGWRGSLVIRFRPRDETSPRAFKQACRIALVILAIDAGPVTRTRRAVGRKTAGSLISANQADG